MLRIIYFKIWFIKKDKMNTAWQNDTYNEPIVKINFN